MEGLQVQMQAEHERRMKDFEMQLKSTESRVTEWIQQQFTALQLALNFHYSVPAMDLYSPKLGKNPSTSKTLHYIYELHKLQELNILIFLASLGPQHASILKKTYLSTLTCYQLGIHV